MDQETVNEEAAKLCEEIKRISGGGTSVRFGDFIQDETIEQTFEAPMGTLKAARRLGLLTYDGELLLKGQHDDYIISLLNSEAPAAEAAAEAAPAEAAPAEEPVTAAETAVEEQAPPAAEPVAAAETEVKEEAAVAEETAPVEAAPVEAPTETAPTETAEAGAADDGQAGAADEEGEKGKDKDGKWKVNTSYIDWRTADPNNLETRRGSGDASTDAATAVAAAQPNATKTDDGKWNQVDTSYINHRTDDPNRLLARRASDDKINSAEIASGAAMLPSAQKDEEGKWKQVNTSYINHRTSDPNCLEVRRSSTTQSLEGGTGAENVAGAAPSATVKKESDGKWKVDTSYIGYRTADTNNLDRKLEGQEESKYADPAATKYSYEELKGVNRPDDVDPAQKQSYLADAEFETVMGMSPDAFIKMPKWKQQNLKKAKELF